VLWTTSRPTRRLASGILAGALAVLPACKSVLDFKATSPAGVRSAMSALKEPELGGDSRVRFRVDDEHPFGERYVPPTIRAATYDMFLKDLVKACHDQPRCPLDDPSARWSLGTYRNVPDGDAIVTTTLLGAVVIGLPVASVVCFGGDKCSNGSKTAVIVGDVAVGVALVAVVVFLAVAFKNSRGQRPRTARTSGATEPSGSKLARHEDAERILDVVTERPAAREAGALVQAERRHERLGGARLEPEAPHAARARLVDDEEQDRAPDAAPEEGVDHAHRLDLATRVVEALQRAATREVLAGPRRPERHAGRSQLVEVEGVHALRRRVRVHAREVAPDERPRRRAGEVVGAKGQSCAHVAVISPGALAVRRAWSSQGAPVPGLSPRPAPLAPPRTR